MKAVNKQRLFIFMNKLFVAGLLARLALLFCGGGSTFEKFFVPFLDAFAKNPTENPWRLFAPEYFPYGLFPLLIVGLPKGLAYALFGDTSLGYSTLNFLLIKGPLLGFDILMFWILSRFSTLTGKRLLWFYWLNPLVIYVSFGLGQMDIISMSLLTTCLFLVGKRHWLIAGVVGGLAIVSKFHVALVFPFIAAYIWNNNFREKALQLLRNFFTPLLLVLLLGFLPLLQAQHLSYSTLSSPEALRLFSAKIDLGLGVDFLFGFAMVILVLGRLLFSTRINFSGLIYGTGLLMGCLVIATHAHPGWYLWITPFLALFFANYVLAPQAVFISSLGMYFIHFLIFNGQTGLFPSITFTLLQVGFLVQLLILYWMVIRQDCQLRYRLRPLMIGISGDSGAGKNHLSHTLQALLDDKNCLVIEGDDYHKWERGDKNWDLLTHLDPKANDLLKMQTHAQQIVRGQSIHHHHYDHGSGRFIQQAPTNPTNTIIFQGLHSLYLKSLRDILDLRIFLDPDEKVRTYWKIHRDVFERGHSLEKVLSSIEKRKTDSEQHIQPQKEKSDWIIEISTDADIDPLDLKRESIIPIYVRYTLYNDEPITELLDRLQDIGLTLKTEFSPTNSDRFTVTVKGSPTAQQTEDIALKLYPQLRHLTRAPHPPRFREGIDGLHQLVLLAILSKRLEDHK